MSDDASYWQARASEYRDRAASAELLIRQWYDRATRLERVIRGLLACEIGPDYARAALEDLDKVRLDEPIADPAERARAVARELRRRGLWATCGEDGFWVQTAVDYSSPGYSSEDWHTGAGPRAIADKIQRQEAERAKKWAGDEEET